MRKKQVDALQALMVCQTQQEAARMAGIDVRTLRNYLADPEFVAEYSKRCASLIDAAACDVRKALSQAAACLAEVSADSNQPTGARVSASKGLLEIGLKYTEYTDLAARVAKIEEQVAADACHL